MSKSKNRARPTDLEIMASMVEWAKKARENYFMEPLADALDDGVFLVKKLCGEVERLTTKPMTLQEACDVLNRFQYEGFNDWEFDDESAWPACKEGDVAFDENGVADLGPVLSKTSTCYVAQCLLRDGGKGGA